MEIHIDRHGKGMGPYSIEEASELLWKKTLRDNDMAWREGMPEWVPLPALLSSIHPTLIAAPTAPAKVETYGDLRMSKDSGQPATGFVPAGPDKGETYGDLSKPKNPFAIKYEISLRVLFNVWGFVFLLLFFGAHRPVINFGSSLLAGDVEGHWWGENYWIKKREREIKILGEKVFNETDVEIKAELEGDIQAEREGIKGIRKDGIMNIDVYSFNSLDQFSVINFVRNRKSPGTVDVREEKMEGSYTILGNKIIYRIKKEVSTLAIGNPEEMEMFWYYKVSDGGKRLLLSTSPDFLEPITLTKGSHQFPPK